MKISVQNIKKTFGNYTALDHVSIDFEDGKFTTLLGPSGCGKTTLLRIIAGLEVPDQGEIYFDEECVYSKEKKINVPPEKRGLGFVFQDFALWPHMTVFENVAFGLRAMKKKDNLKEKVMEALRAVQLLGKEKNYPHQLSGGQQQRVAFARAIVIEPKCILFDEPLSALDALLREEMRVELKRLMRERNITSIFVTHDQLEAMSMSDAVAVILEGKIAQLGTPEQIYHHPVNQSIAKFIGHSNWISDQSMIRPELIQLSKENNEKIGFYKERMKVKDIHFIGDHYEVIVQNDTAEWMIPSQEKHLIGQEINLYMKQENIITF